MPISYCDNKCLEEVPENVHVGTKGDSMRRFILVQRRFTFEPEEVLEKACDKGPTQTISSRGGPYDNKNMSCHSSTIR